MSKTKENSAYWYGANVGDKLVGIERRNKGLVVEIFKLQEAKEGGPLKGDFKVKEIGIWKGADKLKDLEDKIFTAEDFIEEVKVRLNKPKIKWLVNLNGFEILK
jgi:hypothetical protein